MNLDELTIGQLKQVADIAHLLTGKNTSSPSPHIGRVVIVRSRDAGVLYGECVAVNGHDVTLKNARQMWYWKALTGFVLVDCATKGVKSDACKFSTHQKELTVFNVCAIFDVEPDAFKSLELVNDYVP